MITRLICAFLMALACAGVLADEASLPALKAIEQFGSIAIDDGSSYYAFSKDGSFRSGPLGMGGREFEGRWTAQGLKFTVVAKAGWMNGISSNNDHRRIVFIITDVRKRPVVPDPRKRLTVDVFDGYFYIDELVRLPADTLIRPPAAGAP